MPKVESLQNLYFFSESWYNQLKRSEIPGKPTNHVKGMGVICKIKFTSRKTLLDKLKYVLGQLYCYVLKLRREWKSHVFQSLFRKSYENWSNYYNWTKANSLKIREQQASPGDQKKSLNNWELKKSSVWKSGYNSTNICNRVIIYNLLLYFFPITQRFEITQIRKSMEFPFAKCWQNIRQIKKLCRYKVDIIPWPNQVFPWIRAHIQPSPLFFAYLL